MTGVQFPKGKNFLSSRRPEQLWGPPSLRASRKPVLEYRIQSFFLLSIKVWANDRSQDNYLGYSLTQGLVFRHMHKIKPEAVME
jgi:hypothetical protein